MPRSSSIPTPARTMPSPSCWRRPRRRNKVLGIVATTGNVPLALTQRNARIVRELAGRPEVPVYAG